MSQDNLVGLECTACRKLNYHTRRNQKTVKERLRMKKFCAWCKKHVEHKETKV